MESVSPGLVLSVSLRLLVSAAVLAWGWVCSRAAARRMLGARPWDLEVLAATTLLTTVITASGIVLGACGLLRDWTWALGATAGFALLRAASGRGAPASAVAPAPAGAGGAVEPFGNGAPRPSSVFVVVVLGTVLARLAFGVRNPPADWDSVYYHLPMIAHWLQSGTLDVAARDPAVFGSYFPGNGELLGLWAVWSTGLDTLVGWPGTLALGLLALAVRRGGLLLGAARPVAEGVAIVLVLAPGLVQLTLGVRVDQLVALWLGVALVAALRLRREGARGDAAFLLLAVGLLSGTKSTGPALAGLMVFVALLGPGAGARARALLTRRAALLAVLVVAGFWYARNALATGNPEFPASVRLGPWALPGLLDQELMRRTAQVFVWLEGWPGHTTARNLWRFFGPALPALALGLGFAIPALVRRPPPGARMLATVSAVAALLFLFGPFSGAYWPAEGGRAPRLNLDNLRLLLPALMAAAPLAAVGLSRLGMPRAVGAALVVVALAGLVRYMTHLVPGLALAALPLLAYRPLARWGGASLLARRPLLAAVPLAMVMVALALAVVRVEARRERVTDEVWDCFAKDIHNVDARLARALRIRAGGRPIACAGLDSWWAFYGRAFRGRPVYVPVAPPRARAPGWEPAAAARARADRAAWLAALERSGAAFVVVGSPGGDCTEHYVEGDWCAADTARFEPVARRRCARVFRVRAPRAEAIGGAAP
jgi:hypothetical protein